MRSGLERGRNAFLTSPVVELRQYTLRPGKRDALIDVFEREFVDAQERAGIEVVGQFRDVDNSERFVWLRGFPDMPSRPNMLESFYSCPEWKSNREMVNEILVDYDNVLLLRNAWEGSGFPTRARVQNEGSATTLVTASIHDLNRGAHDEFVSFFKTNVRSLLTGTGASSLASLVTETAPNNYPRLPVREGESVFVSFHSFENHASYDSHLESLNRATVWSEVRTQMERWHTKPLQTLKLVPTPRSKLK